MAMHSGPSRHPRARSGGVAQSARLHRETLIAAAFAVGMASAVMLLRAATQPTMIDLRVYLGAADLVRQGGNLYDYRYPVSDLGFTYPPFAVLVILPLSPLPFGLVSALMTAGNIVLLALLLRLTLTLQPLSSWIARSGGTRRAWQITLVATGAALWLEPVLTTMRYGQVNLALAVLVLYDLSRPDPLRYKGMIIGLAAGFKLTPGIFAVYLWGTRRYRAAGVATGAFLATVAVGWLAFPDATAHYFFDGTFLDATRVGRIENAANQSLRGGLARTLHTADVEGLALTAAVVTGIAGLAAGRATCHARGVPSR